MSEMQDAFEAEKANSDKAFDMYIEAQAAIEAQSKLIEELREALAPVGSMEMWTETADDADVVIMTVGTIRKMRTALYKANPHSEKVDSNAD